MKSRTLAFGCLIIGGALALVSGAQPWWRAVGEGVVVKFSGIQGTGGLSQALAIVALAGTLLLLVLRTRGRRIVGTLLFLVGAALAVLAGFRLQPSADAIHSQVRQVSLADALQLSATAWPWVYALSGVLVAGGAVVTMITTGAWPSAPDRFQAGLAKPEGSASDDPAELWKAMDAGVDPTTTAATQRIAASEASNQTERDARAAGNRNDLDTAKVPHPDVQDRAAGDTMEDTGRQEREA